MNEKTTTGLWLVGGAVILGVLIDALLRETPWGLNMFLWMTALSTVILVVVWRRRIPLTWGGRWLLVPAMLLAAGFAWRDSSILKTLDGLALVAVLAMLMLRARSGNVLHAAVLEYPLGVARVIGNALLGGLTLLFADIHWKEIPREGRLKHAGAVGRGLLIALPLLVLFGGLFASADTVFEGFVNGIFRVDTEAYGGHLLIAVCGAWLTAGYLRALLLTQDDRTGDRVYPAGASLGAVELATVLALLDVLFLSFVLVQLRYFFGGDPLVQVTPNLTYADYARRGFFELVTVAALTLPLLLLAHWLLPKNNTGAERHYRILAGVQVALLMVIMASALQRMRLYQSGYGMTELRLYVTAFMGWLAVVFVWFVLTVLRGRRDRFAFGAVFAAFIALLGLHALNPDAYIVRANAVRAAAGKRFDAAYNASLSADAVPALLQALPSLPSVKQKVITRMLESRWRNDAGTDWRAWNWSRRQAWRSMARMKSDGQVAAL